MLRWLGRAWLEAPPPRGPAPRQAFLPPPQNAGRHCSAEREEKQECSGALPSRAQPLLQRSWLPRMWWRPAPTRASWRAGCCTRSSPRRSTCCCSASASSCSTRSYAGTSPEPVATTTTTSRPRCPASSGATSPLLS